MPITDFNSEHLIVPIQTAGLPLVQRALMMLNYRKNYQMLRKTDDYTWCSAEDGGSFLGSIAALDLQFGDQYPMLINIKDAKHVEIFKQSFAQKLKPRDVTQWHLTKFGQTNSHDLNVFTGQPLPPVEYAELKRQNSDTKVDEVAKLTFGSLKITTDSSSLLAFEPVLDVLDELLNR